MTKKNINTEKCIKNLNIVIDTLNKKDERLNEWKSIRPGCDSPHNMKNHIDKLNKELSEWQTLIPDYHTPKLAAKRITKLETDLMDWQSAVPNCDTPAKLKAWVKKYQSEEKKQEIAEITTNFKTYVDFISGINDLTISDSDITIDNFYNAKIEILNYINDPETQDNRIRIIDDYKIIDFLIYEFNNHIIDPQVSNDKLSNINRRFNGWS